jgi:hypothetical protein
MEDDFPSLILFKLTLVIISDDFKDTRQGLTPIDD